MNFPINTDIKLLHVEDSELDAKALKRAFEKLGVNLPLCRARDGVEALEILNSPDGNETVQVKTVVLLDINMPRMNGIEFLQVLRDDPQLHQIPVFVLTTSDRPADIDQAYAHNVAGYIIKPVGAGNFVERIRQWYNFMSIIELPKSA